MRPFSLLLLASLVLAPLSAGAADVPVTYTVDTTALKLAISGTNLTFKLFTDAACTATAHTQVLTVDNVSLLSVLKRSKPKNGLKPPKTTDVRATLTGVAPAAPLYLTVTGTGINAVGGSCQVQSATASGQAASGLLVKDMNGTVLGPIVDGFVILSDGGTPVAVFEQPTGFSVFSNFYYASVDCTGPPLYFPNVSSNGFVAREAGIVGTTLYYGPLSAPLTAWSSSDYAPEIAVNCTAPGQVFNPPDRCCCTAPTCSVGAPFMSNLAPPSTMDISGFNPPFNAGF